MVKKPIVPSQKPAMSFKRSSQPAVRPTQAIQPKSAPSAESRPQARSGIRGVIQAYMPGGIRVLQARMAAQNAIQRKMNADSQNSVKSPAQRNNPGAANRPS